jgi:EAL domain-containing protein (putative c-di-GMP-specific phosphodiesterase class I)/GGDEF domain-containing protein
MPGSILDLATPRRNGVPGTDLPDRLVTLDRIGEAVARAHRAGHDLVLLLVGMNDDGAVVAQDCPPDFAAVVGEAQDRLHGALPGEGTVARVSDTALAVMVSGEAAGAMTRRCATRILAELARPFGTGGAEIRVTAAVGASAFPRDATRPDVLLQRAEQALGAARRAGPNAFRSVQPRARGSSDADYLIRKRLDTAVARDELVLHYQPKYDLTDGRIVGAEALLRWRHPELGLVEPARFIPVAEASGLIVPIGEWVLHAACDQVRRWRGQGIEMPVGVNVSARQFREPDLAQRILDILQTHEVDPCGLEVELTESAVMDDAASVVTALERLKVQGVRIAIDDFGTGYANLSYLTHLPVDVVKIDRSYVRDVGRRGDNGATVQAIIRFARALGMEVIAEGVESGVEADCLREWGCHHAQGFFFGRPAGAKAFAARLGAASRVRARSVSAATL